MPAPKGNQFWKLRAEHGRDKLFETPEALWDAACEYFQWCEDNPLQEQKAFAYQGVVIKESVNKMRAFTLGALCLYLDCDEAYFRSFKAQKRQNKEDFITVISKIEKTIYNQKFTGAAADLLNANIIARDLGLSDKTENKSIVASRELTEEENDSLIDQIEEEVKKLSE